MNPKINKIDRWFPQQLSDFAGNDRLHRLIRSIEASETLNTNLFITGEVGTAKSEAARFLLRVLLCERIDRVSFKPCMACANCPRIDLREGNAQLFQIHKKGRSGGVISFQTLIFDCANISVDEIAERVRDSESITSELIIVLDEVQQLSRTRIENRLLVTMDQVRAGWIAVTSSPSDLSRAFIRRFRTKLTMQAPSTEETIQFLSNRITEFGLKLEDDGLLGEVAVKCNNSINTALSFFVEVAQLHDGTVSQQAISEFDFDSL